MPSSGAVDVDGATLEWLQAPDGQQVLAELAQRDLRDATLLAEIERLRVRIAPEHARAAVELALLRVRARAKFSHADAMYFIREALEQATAEPVAQQRARRIAAHGLSQQIVDLGCGIGGDALAFAAAGFAVTALDRDPLRVALAQANAAALGLQDRISFICADVDEPPASDVLFCDPARRSGGRRVFDVAQYQPPLDRVFGWRARTPALCVKLAPGVPYEELPLPFPHEIECVSLGGELKETVLWCGPLASTPRRATVLAAGTAPATLEAAPAPPVVPVAPPAAWLYEPDPAVIRAHLVGELAQQIGAAQLDAQIAYLSADQLVATPFARAWPVLEWLPFQLKRLRARLRALHAGSVTVKKRGSPIDTDALARQLSSKDGQPLVVALTRTEAGPIALICGPPVGGRTGNVVV